MTASRRPQMAAQLGHFRLLMKPKHIGGAGEAILFLGVLWQYIAT